MTINADARLPAEAFPLGQFIREEIAARGLTKRGFEVLLFSAGCTTEEVLACQIAAYVDDPCLILDETTANCLGRAFEVSPDFFMNLYRRWREWNEAARAAEGKDDY